MDENLNFIFAENLRYYIEKKGINQTILAENIGVNRSMVTHWCSGKNIPRMDKIEKIAKYFGIKKTDLIEIKKPVEIDELRETFIKLYDLIPPERRAAVLEVLRSVIKSFQEP